VRRGRRIVEPVRLHVIDNTRSPQPLCIWTNKSLYRDPIHACVAAIVATLRGGETIHVYLCSGCGCYHMTHMEQREDIA